MNVEKKGKLLERPQQVDTVALHALVYSVSCAAITDYE